MNSLFAHVRQRSLSLLPLLAVLNGCCGTLPEPGTPATTAFLNDHAETLDCQATTVNTTGTVLLALGTTGAIAGTAVLVENSGKGEPTGWKAELTASVGAMAVGIVLRLIGAGMRERADQAAYSAAALKDRAAPQQSAEKPKAPKDAEAPSAGSATSPANAAPSPRAAPPLSAPPTAGAQPAANATPPATQAGAAAKPAPPSAKSGERSK